jgi:HAD superfamily hydrolase (TIGR01662 family)
LEVPLNGHSSVVTPEQATASGVVLFDRDGTLILDVPFNGDPALVQPVEGAIEAVAMVRAAGVALGVISNQSGVSRGLITHDQVDAVNARVEEMFGPFDVMLYCEHQESDHCECRKPKGGMVKQACDRLGISTEKAIVIGDIGRDVNAALSVGAKAVLVPTPATLESEIEMARKDADVIVVPNIVQAARAVLNDGLGVGRVSRLTTQRSLNKTTEGIAALHAHALIDALMANGPALDRAQVWGELLAEAFERGNKVIIAGNGGSAAQASHLAAELLGRFNHDRRPLPAIAITDITSLTAIANDFGYQDVFARPVGALCQPRDVVILLSASGRSKSILGAVGTARRAGASVWAMTGPAPNPLASAADDAMAIEARSTAVVQEIHLAAVHVIAEAVEHALTTSPDSHAMRSDGSVGA